MPTSIPHLLTWARDILIKAGVPSPRADAEWTLAHVLECSRSELLMQTHHPLTPAQNATYRTLIHRRADRIPLQHLLGNTEFYGFPFHTSPDALIPRPETEILIEATLNQLNTCTNPRILDIGTGSGIIAITLGKALPESRVIATDISRKALRLASKNAHLNGIADRISFLQTDLLTPFAKPESFHAILSNPPYIPSNAIDALQPEVRDCDPRLALDGGCDGLDFYRKIIPASISLLAPGGLLALEIGHDQVDAVTQLLNRQMGLTSIATHTDLGGYPRAVLAQRR
ncbi:MAG: peptide chain release factor N(5)-glutamine methyltransferase [Gemmatimonadetes bacterium]|nr:peptide chain release factor N(5)-glutamine methyltransferase [Gemmatimonadota bacterium]